MEPLQGDTRRYRLLYVEDDIAARKLLSKIIAKKYPDLNLSLAEDGAAGLEMYREQLPDIVLTDMEMPVMDGI